ncbi:hypothetical protein [Endozoicomonas sp.]|uniref:hypothetical protein n=1 Tax=Endozoicomonas sp. TaxID=1892382 RepID=UPI002887156C|nr:hypothetical protein [Endozoicomonas sp.]
MPILKLLLSGIDQHNSYSATAFLSDGIYQLLHYLPLHQADIGTSTLDKPFNKRPITP